MIFILHAYKAVEVWLIRRINRVDRTSNDNFLSSLLVRSDISWRNGPYCAQNKIFCRFLKIFFTLVLFNPLISGSLITKIYDKRDDFDFPIVNFPFLDGDIPLAPSYGIYISQLVRFCRICTKVSDFNERNLHLTEKLLKQGYRYHKLLKTFTKFFHRYNVLVHKFGATCRSLIRNGIPHPRFYGNIVYKSYKFKNRTLDISDSLNKFIHKGYKYEIIINTLRLVFRKKDIKLLIPLLNKN